MRYLTYWTLFAFLLSLRSVGADEANLQDLQATAAKGDPAAEQQLGRAYHLGEGVPVDYAKALEWYREAADAGNAKAMHNLGFMYHSGQGVKADDKEAANWFLKAAGKDFPTSELAVGMAYRFGNLSLPRDLPAAEKWLTKAAHHAEEPEVAAPAANVLGTLYESGMDGTGKPDGEKAVFWFKKAADFDYAKAEANLGMYYYGHKDAEGKKDLVTCYMWLRLGTAQRETLSEHLLTDLRQGKELTDEQIAEADKRANAFRTAHNEGRLPALPKLVTPGSLLVMEAERKREQNAANTNAVSAPTAPTGNGGAK